MNPVVYLDRALTTLDQFREVLDGQRDARCTHLEEQVVMARALIVLEKPRELSDGQELQARLEALGLSATRPAGSCPGLHPEYEKVDRRVHLLRTIWGTR